MKRLTLVRHAKSEWGHVSLADMDRPLNARGERDAPDMASRLVAAKLVPSLIITSPAVRALDTARTFASALGYPAGRIRQADEAYLASPDGLLDLIHRLGGRSRHVMLFGHNPGISHFATMLGGDESAGELPTCAVISLLAPVGNWRELKPSQGVRDFYDFPKNSL